MMARSNPSKQGEILWECQDKCRRQEPKIGVGAFICYKHEHLLNDEKTEPMDPWYEGFEGTITKDGENRYKTFGRLESSGNAETRLVTELPIEVWTNNYVSSLDKGKENRGKVSAFIEVQDKILVFLFYSSVSFIHIFEGEFAQ